MSKMGSHDPFEQHKLWPKEGLGIKLAIWLPTTKSRESPQFPCMKMACDIPLESSWWGLQLYFIPHFNRRCTHKVMSPKVAKVPTLEISRLGSPETKCYSDANLVARQKVYYKGKVVVSLKSGPWWILWIRVCPWWVLWTQVCPWFILAPKVLQLYINQLVVWFLQVYVSIDCLSFFFVSSRNSNMSFYPQSVASQGVCRNSLLFRCFHLKFTFESIQELGGVSQTLDFQKTQIKHKLI
jgi:hypothetical protein